MRTAAKVGILAAVGLGALVVADVLRQRRRMDFAGRTAVITGGSRGLGLVLARRLAKEGADLVLLARDAEELERAKEELEDQGAQVLTIACDVTDAGQAQAAVKQIIRRLGRIDALINNAGTIQMGPVEHMRLEDFHEAMQVHAWGPLHMTLAVLPHMRKQGEGRIVNISSFGGKIAMPHLLPYTTSKHALVGLSDGFRTELSRYRIFVTTVCPGLMRTGSHVNALFRGRHRQEYAWFAIVDALPGASVSAQRAARQIIQAMRYGRANLIISLPAKALVLLNHLAPNLTAAMLSAGNRLLPKPTDWHGNRTQRGSDSRSKLTPAALTRLADRAAQRNNQLMSL